MNLEIRVGRSSGCWFFMALWLLSLAIQQIGPNLLLITEMKNIILVVS